jgi:ParB family chromosome partitioning protein
MTTAKSAPAKAAPVKKRGGLGRGLEALLGPKGAAQAPVLEATPADTLRHLPVDALAPGKYQPRKTMDQAKLAELAESIKAQGVIQPIVVRDLGGHRYEIIAGERRWRASQIAGLHEVPIVPVDVSDSDALEFAIIENVQREDLNAMEEAQGYHALANEFKRSQDEIAKIVGKSRSHVANMMRLTKLPAEVQAYIASGQLSAGHARALIGVPDPTASAKRIVEEGLNVRQAEAMAHVEGVPVRKPQKARGGTVKDPNTVALEKRVGDALGLAVNIDHRDAGGTVHIRYRDLDQLDEVVRRLVRKG